MGAGMSSITSSTEFVGCLAQQLETGVLYLRQSTGVVLV
jgi:hypothetical protein